MAERGVHCVVVEGLANRGHRGEELVWGIVSDLDLVRAAANDDLEVDVGDLAATEIVTVDTEESVARAIQVMSEHEIAHLVVVRPVMGELVGVLSTLDVARFIASAETAQSRR